ncbi:MAG: TonB-dependent receptor [Chryseolinea sp.]
MKAILILLLNFTTIALFGQTNISGKVTDGKGEPVPGANVVIEGSYDGVSTSADGAFSFPTSETGRQTLVVTFIGYKESKFDLDLDGKSVKVSITLKEEFNTLDAVVISAGSFTAEGSRRTILKPMDIATTAGATADIAGALNTLPGTQKVGESGRLFVRGGDGSETRTFIDGMVVLDAYNSTAPNTPSRGRFLPFMFKGTSFSTGGYSAEYGQALSSALVLNSKDKSEITQTDIGILSVGADVAHTQVWDRASLSGKIQYTDIRPYFNFINQVVDWKKPPVAIEAHSAYRQKVGKTGLLKLYGNMSNTKYSLFNHDVANPSIKQLLAMDNKYTYGNAVYQQALNETWNVRGGLSYSYNQNAETFDEKQGSQTENGLHGKLVFENSVLDNLDVRLGVETISRRYAETAPDTISHVALGRSFNETITAPFVEAEVYATSRFVAKAGVRVEYDNLNAVASVDPRISLAYKPGTQGQFSFAYGKFRQSAQNIYLVNNRTLASEKAQHFILNYQIITNRKTFRIETYYKEYSDLVKYVDTDRLQTSSDGKGYAKGIELFWRDSESISNVDYWISYSFLDTKRNYLDFPHNAVPTFASRHNFSFVYKHFIPSAKTQLGVTYSYGSGRSYFNPNSGDFHSNQTPDYHDLSANLSFLPTHWIVIHASCTNLLGRDNIFGFEYSDFPNSDGSYSARAITQPAKHFLFLGVFITLSKNKSVNQLPNL